MTSNKFHKLFGKKPRKAESEVTQFEMDIAASIQKVTEEVAAAEDTEEEEEQPNTQDLLEDVAKELVTSDENDLEDDEPEQMVDSGHQVQEIFLTAGDDATAGAGEGDLTLKNKKDAQVVPESNGHLNGDQEVEEQLD